MNGDIDSSFGFVLVEDGGDLFHKLVVPCVCRAENNEDADGVFINVLLHKLSVEAVVDFADTGRMRASTSKLACELFPEVSIASSCIEPRFPEWRLTFSNAT